MSYLMLVRHGKSDLKPGDRFVGWMDVPLSRKGIGEALDCSVKLEDIEFDLAFVSNLVRAQETLFIILSGQKKTGILVREKTNDESGRPFPKDTYEQLELAVKAVFDSWMSPRAKEFRKIHNIKGARGTAVTIQAMVFGNMDLKSSSGIAFTRNPWTGE